MKVYAIYFDRDKPLFIRTTMNILNEPGTKFIEAALPHDDDATVWINRDRISYFREVPEGDKSMGDFFAGFIS